MTGRERMLTAYRNQQSDCVPVSPAISLVASTPVTYNLTGHFRDGSHLI